MIWLTDLVYTYVALPLFWIGARASSIFNAKLRRRFAEDKPTKVSGSGLRILFHASSMGEFEQLLPVIRLTKSRLPHLRVVASFFSPSGYAHGLRTSEVDVCTYLPFDSKRGVRAYLKAIQPKVIVIDRYDVWRNFIVEATAQQIPVFLINATFPSGARGVLRPWFADTYRRIHFISAITLPDAQRLSQLTRRPVSVLNDTRIDRVLERRAAAESAVESTSESAVESLRRNDVLTIVLGSTWPPDEDIAIGALDRPGVRLIIAPHEPTHQALAAIEARVSCTRLSRVTPSTSGHILVDTVGHLLSLYAIADAAYIGGGFGVGVHSVTEPAVFGMPIATGRHIERSADASRLHTLGLLTIARSANDVSAWYDNVVADKSSRLSAALSTRDALVANAGASLIHAERITELMLR